MAAPQDDDDYRKRAWNLGYGEDTFRMCVEHEIVHTLLGHLSTDEESPTLRAVANGEDGSAVTDHEENAVLAIQLFCNTAGINLLDMAARYAQRIEENRP